MTERAAPTRPDDGFTLIELLVVMIIIGILAAIAIPSFLDQRRSAVNSGQVADLRSVANEVESFMAHQDQFPTTFVQAGGQVTMTAGAGTGVQRVTVGNSMTYTVNGTGTAYCLVARNPKAAQDRLWISDAGGIQPVSVTTCPF